MNERKRAEDYQYTGRTSRSNGSSWKLNRKNNVWLLKVREENLEGGVVSLCSKNEARGREGIFTRDSIGGEN